MLKVALKFIVEARKRAIAKSREFWIAFYAACVEGERKRIFASSDHERRKAEAEHQNRPYIIVHNPNGPGSVRITDPYVVNLVNANDFVDKLTDQIEQQMLSEGRQDNFLCTYPTTTSKDVLEAALDLLKCCDWPATVEEPGVLRVRPLKFVEAQQ